jgi:cobalt-zinc-cadmium efflux system outer membrane protein
MKRLCLVLFCAFAIGSPPVHGQDGLTLDQAVSLALRRNPAVLVAEKGVSAALGKRMQLEAIADPTLVFRDEGLAFRGNADGTPEKEISFGLEQNLEFPGKRSLRAEIGRAGEVLAGLALDRTRLLVSSRVKKAYYAAVLSKKTAESLEKSSGLLEEFIASLLAKYQAGDTTYADVLRAKVEKARLQNQILEERKNGAAARGELNLLLGRRGDEPLVLATDMTYAPLAKSLAAWKEEARAASPTLKLAAAKRGQSATALLLARKSILPDFSLGLYFPSLRTGSWGFSVGLSLPVWRTRTDGEVREAEAAKDIAALSESQEEIRLMARIDQAFETVRTAEEQVKIFEQKLLKDLEDELKMSVNQYGYAKLEFFSLLDLYRTYAAAQLEHLKSVFLYLTSLADLEVAGENAAE